MGKQSYMQFAHDSLTLLSILIKDEKLLGGDYAELASLE